MDIALGLIFSERFWTYPKCKGAKHWFDSLESTSAEARLTRQRMSELTCELGEVRVR